MSGNCDRLTGIVKEYAFEQGADLVGIATVERWAKAPLRLSPLGHMPDAKAVVVMGVHHPDAAIEMGGFPTPHDEGPYAIQYCMNNKLDHLNWRLARCIEDHGFKALPIASSNIWRFRPFKELTEGFTPDICHMYAAVCAGLGEIGWNNLLLTPEYGPRQRVISLITDAPLATSDLYRGDPLCDRCMECARHCPTDAFRKELKGKSRIEIEDRLFEFANKNKWRCSWAECFALSLDIPRPEKIDETVILESLQKYGVHRGEIGYCLKYCLPPHLRGPLHSNGSPRRKYSAKHEGADSGKVTKEIGTFAVARGCEIVAIAPIPGTGEIAEEADRQLPNARSMISFAIRAPAWDHDQAKTAQKLIGFLTLEICSKMERFSYRAVHSPDLANEGAKITGLDRSVATCEKFADKFKTIPSAGQLSLLAGGPTALGKRQGTGIFTPEYGANQAIGLILTDAPLRSLRKVSDTTKRRLDKKVLNGSPLLSLLMKIARKAGADLAGACQAACFDGLKETLAKTLGPGRPSWSVVSERELNCGFPSRPKILERKIEIREPGDYLQDAKSVLVVGVKLPACTVQRATLPPAESPGPYAYAVCQAMNELSFLAFRLSNELESMGYKSVTTFDLTGTAGQAANPRGLLPGVLSNRFVAVAAGLAVFGRSGVALTGEYGPHQRFVAIITDADLPATGPMQETDFCKECRACIEACPMRAISSETLEVPIGGKYFRIPMTDQLRCEWASRYGLVSSEGPVFLGAKDDIPIPKGAVTVEAVCDAIRKRDALQRPFTCIVEPCVMQCPLPRKS